MVQVEQIQKRLDACLATDQELAAARCGQLEDPLWGDSDAGDDDDDDEPA